MILSLINMGKLRNNSYANYYFHLANEYFKTNSASVFFYYIYLRIFSFLSSNEKDTKVKEKVASVYLHSYYLQYKFPYISDSIYVFQKRFYVNLNIPYTHPFLYTCYIFPFPVHVIHFGTKRDSTTLYYIPWSLLFSVI